MVVARPATAKINGCVICKNSSLGQSAVDDNALSQSAVDSNGLSQSAVDNGGLTKAPCSPPGTCANSDFPLWLFVSADLYATKVDVIAGQGQTLNLTLIPNP